ncbi:MAG: hypothetical protein LC720_01905 [Actinobacteria bacterium]|nr:hypothetical protein [Actinomycetota bacterium]
MKAGLTAILLAGVVAAGCGGGGGGAAGAGHGGGGAGAGAGGGGAAGAGHGGGGAGAGAGGGGQQVTLRLKGANKRPATACGTSHLSARYAAGATILFAGTLTPLPTGRYKVEVKVKVCRGGVFSPVAKVRAVLRKRDGTFTGILPKLPAGDYFARAAVLAGAGRLARSEKRHFTIG